MICYKIDFGNYKGFMLYDTWRRKHKNVSYIPLEKVLKSLLQIYGYKKSVNKSLTKMIYEKTILLSDQFDVEYTYNYSVDIDLLDRITILYNNLPFKPCKCKMCGLHYPLYLVFENKRKCYRCHTSPTKKILLNIVGYDLTHEILQYYCI